MKNNNHLNFGAGNPVKGWINLDSSPFFMFPPVFHKVLIFLGLSNRSKDFLVNNYKYYKFSSQTKLPFSNNSLSTIYTSHVLEHLSEEENIQFFNEALRTLKIGGIVRVLVPNLEKNIKFDNYLFSLEKKLLTLPQELKLNKFRAALESIHGFPSFHKSMFISSKIKKQFNKDWKVNINLTFLESNIDKKILKKVEQKSRTKEALIFELIKK